MCLVGELLVQHVRGSEYNRVKQVPQIDRRPVVVIQLYLMYRLLSSQLLPKELPLCWINCISWR